MTNRFTLGQRIAIAVLAFADRRGADHVRLRRALRRAFPRRPVAELDVMWHEALYRNDRGHEWTEDLSGSD